MRYLLCLNVLFALTVLTVGCDGGNRVVDTSEREKPSAEVMEAMNAEMDSLSGDATTEDTDE